MSNRNGIGVIVRLAATAIIASCCFVTALGQVSGVDVDTAIQRAVRHLQRRQTVAGAWPEQYYAGGETALATLALMQAGAAPDSERIVAAIDWLQQLPNSHVYVTSLKLMVLTQADAKRHKREIMETADWLITAQTNAGLWSYTQRPAAWDHSNSQFALLGLHAAAEAGVRVPKPVWDRARMRVLDTQNRDGGWSYRGGGGSYGSMTAANVSNLNILGSDVAMTLERRFRDAAAPGCGRYAANRPLIEGLNWLGRQFRVDKNPARGDAWLHYWLYAVERAGILSGRQSFGGHDWYRAGAEYLVDTQRADGAWGAGGSGTIADTAFALLFLAKGRKPLLVQKLQWSSGNEWNLDRHDLQNLVEFVGDKLGEPTTWQIIEFDAPMEDWVAAPLLYLQGHEFPQWNAAQREKVRSYVEEGGTLLFEACCGKAEFREGFEAFVQETFPAQPLRELDAGHPVYSAFYELPPGDLQGIDVGCRTSILFSPSDLSCLWEQRDVPELSERAFRLGLNIAAFATGRQALRDRLDIVTLPEDARVSLTVPENDALRLGQVVYEGDWRPDAQALVHFGEYLHEQVGLDVVTAYQPVKLTSDALLVSPIVYMTGHYAFALSAAEQVALRDYLRRGGFLFADACCGREAFDGAFRRTVREMFPDAAFVKLPHDHAIFVGRPGFDVSQVGYKPAALKDDPDRDEPELWGLEIDGRLAIVYSPYALGCGLDGHTCYDCRGLLDEDAREVAANIVLYALTH